MLGQHNQYEIPQMTGHATPVIKRDQCTSLIALQAMRNTSWKLNICNTINEMLNEREGTRAKSKLIERERETKRERQRGNEKM